MAVLAFVLGLLAVVGGVFCLVPGPICGVPAVIVGLLARARKSGLRLLTYGLSDHYVEIFKITRLADFMGIFPDEATALSTLDQR